VSLQSPPPELVQRYVEFYRALLPRLNFMWQEFPGAIPTSWYRSEARNLEVGGAPYSQHRLAWAVDWKAPPGRNREMVRLAQDLGMVGVDEGDHVHVQMYPAGIIPKTFFETTRRFAV